MPLWFVQQGILE